MLEVRCSSLRAGLSSLRTLESLETLHLKGYKDPSEACGDLFGQPLFDCLSLELRDLRELRSFALEGITPKDVRVCSSCTVHVKISGFHSGRHPLWQIHSQVLSCDSLRSLSWESQSFKLFCERGDDIPEQLLYGSIPWNLDKLHLDISEWTITPLPEPMAALRYLSIVTLDIEFHVPASTRWEQVFIYGQNILYVSFEDVDAFARKPPIFSFGCCKPLEPIEDWQALDAALVRSNRDWVSKSELFNGIRHFCNVCPPGRMLEVEIGPNFLCHRELVPCICEACATCLAGQGNICPIPDGDRKRMPAW